MSLNSIVQEVRQATDEILSAELESLPDYPAPLKDAMRYSLLGGGKRIRPLLVRLVARTLNIPIEQSDMIGASIECIHAYSLVHDDLPAMDNDDLRRGRPTCHIKYDEATAILSGDALQSMAFEILSRIDDLGVEPSLIVKLIKELSSASGYKGMCGGQAIDIALEGGRDANHKLLSMLHELKTGALLTACVSMVLILCKEPLTKEAREHFVLFASSIGLAFQVQDDILDCEGTADQIGKPQGSDAENNKLTYPALLGLPGAKKELSKLHQQALHALRSLPYNTDLLENFCQQLFVRKH